MYLEGIPEDSDVPSSILSMIVAKDPVKPKKEAPSKEALLALAEEQKICNAIRRNESLSQVRVALPDLSRLVALSKKSNQVVAITIWPTGRISYQIGEFADGI